MKNEEIFKDVKVGDKLYCLLYGDVCVADINIDGNYQIRVKDKDGKYLHYTFDGKLINNENRILYWTKPDIIEKPRMVTVEEYVWLNP